MPLTETLDTLAGFEPTTLPVISLYLNTQPDQHGRDHYDPFLRKEFSERLKTFELRSPERMSFEHDIERINTYLSTELEPSSNGVAIFACAGANEFWQAVQLDAPIPEHRLYVYNQPHLYPLARLSDENPRYAALLLDTNSARLFVFGGGEQMRQEQVKNQKTSRTSVGGWSQARYQRNNENTHLHHAKEVVDVLDRVVREDAVQHIILAGDEAIIPLFQSQLPQQLADLVIDVVRMDITTSEHEIFQTTLEALQQYDTQADADKVAQLFETYRAGGGGLGVVGVEDTLVALNNGQVDELIISANPDTINRDAPGLEQAVAAYAPGEDETVGDANPLRITDELITKARQTGATVTFIEDAALLESVEGVGALLRYRM